MPALLFARDTLPGARSAPALAALSAAFLLALVGVLAARDVVTFLAFWELMTLVPAAAILVARPERAVRRAVFVYLAITHLGGTGVWVAMLTLANEGRRSEHARPRRGAHRLWHQSGPDAAALVAPAGASGRAEPHLRADVRGHDQGRAVRPDPRAVRVGGAGARWIGFVVLGVGALSAVGGVLYALVQHELKRLLAFHSIENVGIIALALGAAILLRARGDAVWADLAFAAALLHTANHAAFKALLFLARRCVRRGGRVARARSARGAAPAHAVDRLVVL